jgi:hypothetical protein
MNTEQDLPHDFEGREEENIRLENELLKLKMQAELGAAFGTVPGMESLPPELERQFLEQIIAFHQQREENPPVLLREYLGHPVFRPAAELSAGELESEWRRLQKLYEDKGLGVDFLAEYPVALRYDFMASELMQEEVAPLPGWRFIYEEFHPNHDYDQRRRTEEFMSGFFGGGLNEFFMSGQVVTDDDRQIPLEEAQQLLERFHGLFANITDWHFEVQNTSVQSEEEVPEGMPRLGFTEGVVQYKAIHHDGTEQVITGPFKLYMECAYDWWQVMHFYMHGFSWKQAA